MEAEKETWGQEENEFWLEYVDFVELKGWLSVHQKKDMRDIFSIEIKNVF